VEKMYKTDFYSTIFKRRSIRDYDLTPLDENTLAEISGYMDALKPMYGDIKTELKIVSSDNVKRRMMKEAPHYVAVFSEAKEGYLTNVGFMLQQVDLFFSAGGLGSCWQGIPSPTKELLKSSDLEFVIFLAFGKPKEPESLHRSSILEFKRKPLQKITNITGADELMEAVRLAPSATNSQPWFFTGDVNIIHAYSVKPGFIKGLMIKKYIPIDMGIAICHLKVALEHSGKKAEIVFDKTAKTNAPKGHEYIASLKAE
jgi:nitroreductase